MFSYYLVGICSFFVSYTIWERRNFKLERGEIFGDVIADLDFILTRLFRSFNYFCSMYFNGSFSLSFTFSLPSGKKGAFQPLSIERFIGEFLMEVLTRNLSCFSIFDSACCTPLVAAATFGLPTPKCKALARFYAYSKLPFWPLLRPHSSASSVLVIQSERRSLECDANLFVRWDRFSITTRCFSIITRYSLLRLR